MSDNTPIEWADATCNAVNGCSVLSPGCKHCYAMKQAHRVDFRRGLVSRTAGGQVWNGDVYLHEKSLLQPLRWRRPRRIFWNAHGDLFHKNVPDAWIDRVFAVCALTPQHTHMILTKRPDRMREYMTAFIRGEREVLQEARDLGRLDDACDAFEAAAKSYTGSTTTGPLPNVWLGTSVEDQARADERIPHLLATPAALRFLSMEPLLGPVDLTKLRPDGINFTVNALLGKAEHLLGFRSHLAGINWVIVGGESGSGARPMHPDWARSLRDQCAAAGVPFFFKQWGAWGEDLGPPATGKDRIFDGNTECAVRVGDAWQYYPSGYCPPMELCTGHNPWLYRIGKKAAGRLLDGREHSDFPSASTRGVGSAGEPA